MDDEAPKAVPLSRASVVDFLQSFFESLDQKQIAQLNSLIEEDVLDLSKEFRSRTFAIVHLLLQNPLTQMFSTAVPNLQQMMNEHGDGFLFLFDARTPNYLEDNMDWAIEKRMNLKLILQQNSAIQDSNISANQIPNNSNVNTVDTNISPADLKATTVNNTTSSIMSNHYKLKNAKTDQGIPAMRRQTWKSVQTGWQRHEYKIFETEVYYKTDNTGALILCQRRNLSSTPVLVHYFRKADQRKRKIDEIGSPITTPSFKRIKIDPESDEEVHNNNNGHNNTSNNTNYNFQQQQTNSFANNNNAVQIDNNINVNNIIEPSNNNIIMTDAVNHQLNGGAGSGYTLTSSGSLVATNTNNNNNPIGYQYAEVNESPDTLDLGATFDNFMFSDIGPVSPVQNVPMHNGFDNPQSSMQIRGYAPEAGPHTDSTRVILVLDEMSRARVRGKFYAIFDGNEIEAKIIVPGVVEFNAPPHAAGIIHFFLLFKDDTGQVSYSNFVPFCYQPTDGKLSLAYYFLSKNIAFEVMPRFRFWVKELDLSNNNLDSITFLDGFSSLETLILDSNHLNSNSTFPKMENLKTLSINGNLLVNIDKLLDQLVGSCPDLEFLSTLKNPCNPFFSERKHRYYNYRIYILSRLKHLKQLDSSLVQESEMRHATWIDETDEHQPPIEGQLWRME